MMNRIDDILDIINDDKYRKDWKSLFHRLTLEHPLVSVVRRLGAIYEFKKFMALKVVEKVTHHNYHHPSLSGQHFIQRHHCQHYHSIINTTTIIHRHHCQHYHYINNTNTLGFKCHPVVAILPC
jgi:hypothetical protein